MRLRLCPAELAAPLLLLVALLLPATSHAQTPGQRADSRLADLPLNVIRAPGPVTVDGQLNDWVLTAPVSYEVDSGASDRTVRTYAMWDDANLYLAYVVRDASPMVNGGDDPASAFKTGDSLHAYLGLGGEPAGQAQAGGPHDFHLMFTELHGQPVVYAFRQQVAGVTKLTRVATTATHIDLAWQGPVPGAVLAIVRTPDKQGYTAEVSLPWAFFDGYQPTAGKPLAADVAVNFSNATGTTNVAKVWWHRGASQVLDVPTELQFDRARWGQALLRAPGETPIVIDNGNFYVVPAPGPVTIDGDLSKWDRSCAYGPTYVDPLLKDKESVTWVAMYDADALYLGAAFTVSQGLHNDNGASRTWWLGDSLEFRLAADPAKQTGDPKLNDDLLTFGVWYNHVEDKDYIALDRSFRFQPGDLQGTTIKSKAIPGGRSFTIRVPWAVVKSGHVPHAGDQVKWTMSAIWKSGLRAYGMGSISSFRGMQDWGWAHFLAQGQQPLVALDLPKPVAPAAPAGPAPYQTSLTAPAAGLFSAGVYDEQGHLLRTLVAGQSVGAGAVPVGWDGRADDGHALPPGRYAVRALLNAGLHAQYQTSVACAGSPPHASPDPLARWGGVWGNVVDLASDTQGVVALWAMEEGDGALLAMNEDGRLRWRQHIPLALSSAQTAVASNGKYVYVAVDGSAASEGRAGLWRVNAADGAYALLPHEGTNPLQVYLAGITRPLPTKDLVLKADLPPAVPAMAAGAKALYVAAYYQNQVVVLDAETATRVRAYDVPQPLGLCRDGDDALLVVSAKQIVRLVLATGALTPVVSTGLDAPWHVAVAADGTLLVGDRGASQQVKRFGRDGKLLGSYGVAGGRDNNGAFTPQQLRQPAGLVVAASGSVFLSEDATPRQILRLSKDLQYERRWAGPWYLSGEVAVDPEHPEDVYLWSHESYVRLRHDAKTETSEPQAVWSKFALPEAQIGRWFPRVVHHQGVTYLLCTGANVTLFRVDGDRLTLVAVVGGDRNDKVNPMWTFCDRNDNGVCDEGERVTYAAAGRTDVYSGSYWGGGVDERDLTLYAVQGNEKVFALTPTFVKPGVPEYSFDRGCRIIPLAAALKPGVRADISSIWPAPDGGVFGNAMVNGSDPRGIGHSSHLSDVYVFRLDRAGQLLWRAGKKASGIAKAGEFYGRACGLGGPIGSDYFDFLDEQGQEVIYTQDGLYVGKLLEDTATAAPGEYTLFVEHFNSMVFQNTKDQQWYFIAGASGYASIWQIAGLPTVTRLTGEFTIPAPPPQ